MKRNERVFVSKVICHALKPASNTHIILLVLLVDVYEQNKANPSVS